ncbi:adenosine kinase [Phyllobacterium sp. 21LDTY02-6]|jgi:sugar/nucleoside kinase (ribokinase family)|uniref:adenosine kinase n=1 Tax=unclassified Phyllobacterium TaxID=2638441 RepID=UPI0020211B63|nr:MULTISPECIES: adenosine kinase [unclassified Phyllobacterium]MCO4317202.1 adenosine kinase [Phyllobacterium sp. 21LDTY02-6]MCX8278767.1 adenosine kinase [Phyllobacterium sp. 0TCS1.6C]MCX8293403.1 adenosine kinase [Phyllobacterium sp. 0TCS1.6A]
MSSYDVLCIGNAIVDILARTDEEFIVKNGIIKNAMNLIDADRAEFLYERMGPAIEASGGSAGNTAAGVASLGGRAAYFGKVADDQLGHVFTHDIRSQGVAFDTRVLQSPPPTARSLIFVTPDGDRSMNTYLGACVELGPEDVESSKVAEAKVTYFEGYLWDPPRAKEAIRLAAKIAHEYGREVSMTLSDPFCVDRYRDEFLDLMRSGTVDIIFANEAELKSLYQTDDFDKALDLVRKDSKLAAVTRSEKGSVVVRGDETVVVPAIEIAELVDTTGAGDLYASGFLFGYTNGRSLGDCGRLGSLAAGLVIQQIGPRPQQNLKLAAEQAGLI